MSNELDYTTLESPYNSDLQRSSSDSGEGVDAGIGGDGVAGSATTVSGVGATINSPSQIGDGVIDGQSMKDLWIESWIKSRNYKPKTSGFFLDGKTGNAEFANITLSGGNIQYGKTSFSDSTNAGYFMSSDGVYFGAASDTTKLKYTISTGSFDFIGTISSRSTDTVAAAINSGGNLITDVVNARLDSGSKTILSDFTFSPSDYSGAFKTGDITWNSGTGALTGGTGIVINKKGIIGASVGSPTFSIDTDTGDASFAGDITASTMTTSTITGGTIQTSMSPNKRVVMENDKIEIYNALNVLVGKFEGITGTYASGIQASIAEIDIIAMTSQAAGFTVGTGKDGLITIDGSDLCLSTYHSDGSGGNVKLIPGTGQPIMCYEDITPNSGGGFNLGDSTNYWGKVYIGTTNKYIYDNAGALWYNGAAVSTGEANTASSLGGTYSWYDSKSGVDLRFRGFSIGSGLSVTDNTTYWTLNHAVGDGHNHIPTGGTTYYSIRNSASGTGVWSRAVYVGYSSMYFDSTGLDITCSATLKPVGDATIDLGTSTLGWRRIYIGNGGEHIDESGGFLTTNVGMGITGNTSVTGTFSATNGITSSSGLLTLTASATSPSSAGQIRNYASGAIDQFRGVPGDGVWVGSFDMTGV